VKKVLLGLVFILALASVSFGQSTNSAITIQGMVEFKLPVTGATYIASTGDNTFLNQTASPVQYHQLIYRTNGTISTCTLNFDGSDDNSTWTNLSSTTCTSRGATSIVTAQYNYYRISAPTFTVGSSNATLRVTYIGTVSQQGQVVAKGRYTAQTGSNASIATFTPTVDSSFLINSNVLVTTATSHSFSVICSYTDEGGSARNLILTFGLVAGGVTTTLIANGNGAAPYHGVTVQIRCKANTAITLATSGTFTTVVYNVEGMIRQIS
jgi:hypothetical protein